MKLGVMKAALPDSLTAADQVYCYGANLGWDAAEALAPLGRAPRCSTTSTRWSPPWPTPRPGDHVLMMSNGGFGGVHDRLLAALAAPAAPADRA